MLELIRQLLPQDQIDCRLREGPATFIELTGFACDRSVRKRINEMVTAGHWKTYVEDGNLTVELRV